MKDDNQHSYEFPLYDWLTGVNSETEPAEKKLVLYHGKREFIKLCFVKSLTCSRAEETFSKFLGTCLPSCQNGGECVEGRCQCPSSFEGVSCEKGNLVAFVVLC